MRPSIRQTITITTGTLTLIALAWLTNEAQIDASQPWAWFIFGALSIFTLTFGVPVGGGSVSLLPMTLLAAFLVLGLVPTGWIAFISSLVHGLMRHQWPEQVGWRRESGLLNLIGTTAANATMISTSILLGGWVYLEIDGVVPFTYANFSQGGLLIILLALTYLATNLFIVGLVFSMRGREILSHYLRSLPHVLLYEVPPLFLVPLAALIFTELGIVQFSVFAIGLVIISLIVRDQARAHRRLERRIQELDSLQAVGQALNASLEIETIMKAIYAEVSLLMPARNFYVALFDPENDEVSFPLAYQHGDQVEWGSRSTGHGITEHILETRQPLLIEREVSEHLQSLGIEVIGLEARSWLGVPILAGEETLGVIAVQSHTLADRIPEIYDSSHLEVLTTIAAQAAAAIQNARLYARTDEALALRVQELNSILKTTDEGILLVDGEMRALEANRALADFYGLSQKSFTEQASDEPDQQTVAKLGFNMDELAAELNALAKGDSSDLKMTVVAPGPPERPLESAITPVRDADGEIGGWLFVFRDLTEELELSRLRDELTHMLVHDLRSPLVVVRGGLDLIEMLLKDGGDEELLTLIETSQEGSNNMLTMINALLDISKLESGDMPLDREQIDPRKMLEDIINRLEPLAEAAKITLETQADAALKSIELDKSLMVRVLHNLVDNAIKFTPDGGNVKLWARANSKDEVASILFGVSDTGPGIPPDEKDQIFKKYHRIPSIEGRRIGTGLGLSFCKLVVEAHGGEIWVESELGKGSDFIMRLPI